MRVEFYDVYCRLLKMLNEDWEDIPSLDEYVIINFIYYKVIRIVYDYDENIIYYTCERRNR